MEWNRKDLKQRAHQALQENYWKTCFMTALLLSLSIGTVFSAIMDFMDEAPTAVRDIYNGLTNAERGISMQLVAVLVTLTFGLLLLTTIFRVIFDIFVRSPIEVGAGLFMKNNLCEEEKGRVADLAYAFDHDYIRVVKCMLIKRLVEILFTLLLVVPGVIKHYENRMVPYLLTDHPQLNAKEALQMSSQMMKGHKMEAFKLDLSFIWWYLAGLFTLGILSIFFVLPYRELTWAALYDTLKNGEVSPAEPAVETV